MMQDTEEEIRLPSEEAEGGFPRDQASVKTNREPTDAVRTDRRDGYGTVHLTRRRVLRSLGGAVGGLVLGGVGHARVDAAEIKAGDIAAGPDGAGLPAGRGTVSMGEQVYQAKCMACHGPTGTEGPMDKLVGEKLPVKTIGSFWPYATTVFDYIRRAQPFNKPGSLTNEEVYALTAWLLFKNKTIAADQVIDAETLPKVRMPNRDGFVPDPRPDVD
jgi:S-disulfanyl-L-cysteine oxidoreductase SoxD